MTYDGSKVTELGMAINVIVPENYIWLRRNSE